MAAIASTDVTEVTSWRIPRMGKFALYHRIIDIALSGNGGTAADIPATTLGFKIILGAQTIRYTVTAGGAVKMVPVIVETSDATVSTGTGLLTINLADATDATRSAPANVVSAGTLRVHVFGIENS